MRFAMLCYAPYSPEWVEAGEDAVMAEHHASDARMAAAGKLGPSLRLMPTTAAVTIHAGAEPMVLDGPFAETKEQLLGLWVFDADTLEEAIAIGKEYAVHMGGAGDVPNYAGSGKVGLEIRPVLDYHAGSFKD